MFFLFPENGFRHTRFPPDSDDMVTDERTDWISKPGAPFEHQPISYNSTDQHHLFVKLSANWHKL